MNADQTTSIPVIRDRFLSISEWVRGWTFQPSYIIENYNIGAGERGRCRLDYEIKPRRAEYRMCKTTTDINGVWRRPRKSTYRPFYAASVVVGKMPSDRDSVAWLTVGRDSVYMNYPTTDPDTLVRCPTDRVPRRKPTKLGPADTVGECDAWDEWVMECAQLCQLCHSKGADVVMDIRRLTMFFFKNAGRK